MSLSIAVVWAYTLFWALLPAFGFGSYWPEPYGTSCTINWWRMRSSLNDRIYIVLVLTVCFGFPLLTIITSYLVILLTVYRSNRALASIPSSSVSHTSKDLRLAKVKPTEVQFQIPWCRHCRRLVQDTMESLSARSLSLSQSCRKKMRDTVSLSVEKKNRHVLYFASSDSEGKAETLQHRWTEDQEKSERVHIQQPCHCQNVCHENNLCLV